MTVNEKKLKKYAEYYYTNINVYIKFNELENEFLIDIEARNVDGIDIKLSDSLILEKN